MHTATVRFDLPPSPRRVPDRCALLRCDSPAGTMSATVAMVVAAQPGALHVGRPVRHLRRRAYR